MSLSDLQRSCICWILSWNRSFPKCGGAVLHFINVILDGLSRMRRWSFFRMVKFKEMLLFSTSNLTWYRRCAWFLPKVFYHSKRNILVLILLWWCRHLRAILRCNTIAARNLLSTKISCMWCYRFQIPLPDNGEPAGRPTSSLNSKSVL